MDGSLSAIAALAGLLALDFLFDVDIYYSSLNFSTRFGSGLISLVSIGNPLLLSITFFDS
jgi:hypothetical protein